MKDAKDKPQPKQQPCHRQMSHLGSTPDGGASPHGTGFVSRQKLGRQVALCNVLLANVFSTQQTLFFKLGGFTDELTAFTSGEFFVAHLLKYEEGVSVMQCDGTTQCTATTHLFCSLPGFVFGDVGGQQAPALVGATPALQPLLGAKLVVVAQLGAGFNVVQRKHADAGVPFHDPGPTATRQCGPTPNTHT